MTRLLPCVGCGQPTRTSGRWTFCAACDRLASAWLRAEVGYVNPDQWVRARNLVMGRRGVFRSVVRLLSAERAAVAGVAG